MTWRELRDKLNLLEEHQLDKEVFTSEGNGEYCYVLDLKLVDRPELYVSEGDPYLAQ